MASIVKRRFYPRDLYNLDQFMDRFFDINADLWGSQPLGFPLDVIEKDTEFIVRADAAGFDPELLEITYDNNTLSIKGEIKEEYKEEKPKSSASFSAFFRNSKSIGICKIFLFIQYNCNTFVY